MLNSQTLCFEWLRSKKEDVKPSTYDKYEMIINNYLISFFDHNSLEQLIKIINLLGLEEKKNSFIYELSGGQQQRVALARALASKPAIIFADEPTGNLDAKSSKEVVDLLKIAQRKYHETVILVTHDQEIASIADRVITIEDGKIIQDTNHI